MKKCFYLMFCLCGNLLSSQNLVLNPGFEDHGDAGSGGTQIQTTRVPDWTDPTTGTSDIYYYPNGTYVTSGYPQLDSGLCYGAFYGSPEGRYWAEYLQGTFSKPLVKGQTYKFSVALACYNKSGDGGMSVVNEIGVKFFNTQQKNLAPLANAIKQTPDIKLSDDKMITRKNRWAIYYEMYTALGGEKYFIIGTYMGKNVEYQNDYDKSTYFFADNFSMMSTKPLGPIPDWVFANDSTKTGYSAPHSSHSAIDRLSANDQYSSDLSFSLNAYRDPEFLLPERKRIIAG